MHVELEGFGSEGGRYDVVAIVGEQELMGHGHAVANECHVIRPATFDFQFGEVPTSALESACGGPVCGGRTDPPRDPEDTRPAEPLNELDPIYVRAVEACAEPTGEPFRASSPEALARLITGRWFLCEGAFQGEAEEVGIHFEASGEWRLLALDEGVLVGFAGAGQFGTWSLGDNGTGEGGDVAVLLHPDSDSRGALVLTPIFTDEGRLMTVEVGGDRTVLVAEAE